MRQWFSRHLTSLKQGSTISVKSKVANTHLTIRPQWRDDGFLSVLKSVGRESEDSLFKISEQSASLTSLGREEAHLLLELLPYSYLSNDPTSDKFFPIEDQDTTVILDDASTVPDSDRPGFSRHDLQDGIVFDTKGSPALGHVPGNTSSKIALEVPEKVNIDCDLEDGGSISIEGKIEGDIRLRTKNGNIFLKKARGHIIDIEAQGSGNMIFASDLVEAESLRLALPHSGRFRAKRVHVGTCNVVIGSANRIETDVPEVGENRSRLDNDDEGAICDLSSLYTTGEATIEVRSSDASSQAVRIKSSHGHVSVCTTAPMPRVRHEMTGSRLPAVDMGGINGSCEIHIEGTDVDGGETDSLACLAHFDSIEPDSASVIRSQLGSLQLTMDRKIETELRLLSSSNSDSADLDVLLLHEDDEDFEELSVMLSRLDKNAQASSTNRIDIQTTAFTAKKLHLPRTFENIEFSDGWVENKSSEPDSRFDRKLKGNTGSVGKIRLDGAADQALQGFSDQQSLDDGNGFLRPIVAVVGKDKITVETLSWLGNIARRYGFEDTRNEENLGRTATRRGRFGARED